IYLGEADGHLIMPFKARLARANFFYTPNTIQEWDAALYFALESITIAALNHCGGVSAACRMPRASAQKKWRRSISRFIASWEWPDEKFFPAHFAAVAVENAACVSGTAIWLPDSSHCSHRSGLDLDLAFDHGREHQHWS